MSSRNLQEFTCDQCKKKVQVEEEVVRPKGWIDLIMILTSSGTIQVEQGVCSEACALLAIRKLNEKIEKGALRR